MAVTKRIRYEVLSRCGFACFYCGLPAGVVELQIDHLYPRRHGGTDHPSNLVAACRDCNIGKSDSIPEEAIVERAYGLWCSTEEVFGRQVRRCSVCRHPIAFHAHLLDHDEEPMTECPPCSEALCDAYESGLKAQGGRHG